MPDPERVAGRAALGRRGERLAERHLKKLKYKRLARNLRNRFGEIDLLMRAPREPGEAVGPVVVVEVKSGTRNDRYRPEDHVNRTKQAKLVKLAAQAMRRYRLQGQRFRFDVVAVVFDGPDDPEPEIRHHVGAFRSGV